MDLIQQVYQTYETERLREGNRLHDAQKIEESYELFRERFGRDKLKSLDGELLLETLFNHGNRDYSC